MNIDFLLLIKVLAVVMVPVMVGVMWALPKLLASKTLTKINVGSIVGSIFMASLVGLMGNDVNSSRFIIVVVAIIWGFVGFLIGAYFDVQWRVKLGAEYYREFQLQRAYGLVYGSVGAVISLPLGTFAGWVISNRTALFLGMFISIIIGSVYGGLLGWILDQVVRRRAGST